MAKRPVKRKTERKKVQYPTKAVAKPEAKSESKSPQEFRDAVTGKKNPWQPIETAPSNQLVYVQKDGAILAAILDGHWYVSADGKPTTTIIYNPSHWMPFPK